MSTHGSMVLCKNNDLCSHAVFFNQYYIVFRNNIFTTLYFGNYFFSYILSKNVPVYHFFAEIFHSYPLVQHSSSSPPLLNCVNTLPCEIHNDILTAIFQDNLGKSVPECCHSGFYWSKDDGGGGDSWSYSTCTCKAPVILRYWTLQQCSNTGMIISHNCANNPDIYSLKSSGECGGWRSNLHLRAMWCVPRCSQYHHCLTVRCSYLFYYIIQSEM